MDAETKNFIKEEIESLAIMIAKSFDSQQRSIEAVEGKLVAVEGRIETVQQELTTSIETVQQELTTRIETVRQELTTSIETVRQELTSEVQDVKEHLTTVETKIDRETEMLVVMENTLMDRDLVGEDRIQQVLQRVERIEDHLKLSHSLEPA